MARHQDVNHCGVDYLKIPRSQDQFLNPRNHLNDEATRRITIIGEEGGVWCYQWCQGWEMIEGGGASRQRRMYLLGIYKAND